MYNIFLCIDIAVKSVNVNFSNVRFRWYEDIEITPANNTNFDHFEFIEEGCLRALRIKDCPMAAAGKYKCTTK
jgi:hypothetical protein